MAKSISRRLADSASPTGAIDGTLSTAAQTNITSVGTLSALGVSGEVAAGSLDISGNVDVDGVTNLDVVDIDGAVNMATTLLVTGDVDFNGNLDVDGTTNLDAVDIDGAVDMASTLAVTGNLTVDTNTLVVDATNNLVGIGTSSPAEMLEIFNASSPAIQLNDGGDYKSIMRLAGNDLEIRGSSGSLEFYNGSADGDSSALRMSISAAGITTFIKSGGGNIRIAETASRYVEIMGYAEGGANGSTMALSTIQAGTSTSTERMRIDSSGNVGIGTAAPVHRLHVADASTSRIQVTNNTSGHTNADGYAIGMEGTTRLYHWLYENSYMSFATNNAERLRIAADGNVGIASVPDAWGSAYVGIDIGSAGSLWSTRTAANLTALSDNSFHNGSVSKAKNTGAGSLYTQSGGNHVFATFASVSAGATQSEVARMQILAGGDVSIVDGNLSVANGHGIDFSATGGPASGSSGSPEMLADYEEGTWTPVLNSGSLTNVRSLYRKIGNQVTAQFYVTGINPSANTLMLKIDGLPYNAQNEGNYYASGTISYSGNAVTSGHGILVPYNQAFIYFHLKSGSGGPAVTNNNWIATVGSGQPLIASITYFTA